MAIIELEMNQQQEKEAEEKTKWIRDNLIHLGIPGVEQWNKTLSMEELRQVKKVLKELSIDIIDVAGSEIEIYFQGELIAEWRKPLYVLKQRKNEPDPKLRFYLEMYPQTISKIADTTSEEETKD